MSQLLVVVWGLCLLRRGPQDLPGSTAFATFAIWVHLFTAVLSALLASPDSRPLLVYMSSAILSVALWAGLIWVLLWVRGFANRFNQTLSACMLTQVPFIILQAILLLLFQDGLQAMVDNRPEEVPSALIVFALALVLWQLAVLGNIFGRALDVDRLLATLLAFLSAIVIFGVMQALLNTAEVVA